MVATRKGERGDELDFFRFRELDLEQSEVLGTKVILGTQEEEFCNTHVEPVEQDHNISEERKDLSSPHLVTDKDVEEGEISGEFLNLIPEDDVVSVDKTGSAQLTVLSSLDGIIDTVSANHPIAPLLSVLKPPGKLVLVGAPEKSPELIPFSLISADFDSNVPLMVSSGSFVAGGQVEKLEKDEESIDSD
ncbi:hypothetical protein LXL04_002285 [Taraxacum kok-saghyz]